MHRIWLLPLASALLFVLPDLGPARATPANLEGPGIAVPMASLQFARYGGRGGGGRRVGVRGGYGGRGVAVRGGYGRGAVAARGRYGGRAVAVGGRYGGRAVAGRRYYGGRAVVGRRYYGGVWYGAGRRYWGGRWWAYGVGSCWRRSPIGYVWVCG